ncbi:UNVERIFIED_CONTAM: hypothetical protein FKN15_036306 [Acipenser sinensis]
MDQGPGTVSGGGLISLSENEQRCYSDLYTLCKADSSGKLAASKVGELFRASQLPADTLHQVTELCGAKRLGYFGTGQFYVAMKLLAAAQSGFPVRLESIKSGSVAKNFFTKSKLSIPELSHIWELSDVDCDGALTLPEFCAAFHLIVARKNGFALPEKLPQTLQSAFLQIDAVSPKTKRDGVFLGSYSELVPSSQQKEPAHSEQWEAINELPTTPAPLIVFEDESGTALQQWEAINELPTTPAPLIVFEDESGTALQETNTVESTHPPLSDKSTPKQEPRIDSCMSDPPQELEQQVKSRTRQRYSILYESGAVKQNVLQHVASRVMIEVVHVRQYFSSITALANWPSSFGQWMRFWFRGGWLPPPALPPRPLAAQEENAAKNEAQGQLDKAAGSSEESSPLKDILPAQPPLKPIRRKYRPESQNLDSQDPTPPLPPPSSSSAPGTKPHPPLQK